MSSTFPAQVSVKDIDQKHPELQKNQQLYEDLRLLYKGGRELKENCFRFLVKRQKELGSTFLFRENFLNYSPVLNTVVSYYISKMFENGLEVEFQSKESAGVDEFYADFLEECDRGNSSLELFFSKLTENCLVYGKDHFVIDLPKLKVAPSNLNEQKELGGLNPYLSHVDIQCVQNWQQDPYHNFEWVVIHNKQIIQNFLGKPVTQETWTYYNTTQYAVYQIEYGDNQAPSNMATLVDSGLHAMADQNCVPVICVRTSQHFLGDRLYLSLVQHLNAYNSLGFSLFQALSPVPVLTDGSDKPIDLSNTVSEYSFLHLPFEGKAFWLEPAGTSWDSSQKYLEDLRSDIYRMAHVVSLGRSTRATPAAQSGISKEQEMAPSASVLNNLGTVIKNAVQQTLDAVAAIRGEQVKSDLRGFTFIEDESAATIDIAIAAQALGIHSVTALRELEKQVVRSIFRNDANAALVHQMAQEIEDAPDEAFQTPKAAPGATVALNITERAGTPQ